MAVALCLALPHTFSAQSATNAEIAPGIPFPSSGSIVLLDKTNSQPKVVTLHASEIKSNAHAGSNFARGMVYAGPHSSVELDGVTSSVIVSTTTPVFYIRVATDDPETQRNRVTLVHLRPTKDTRVILDFSANVFGGSRKRHVEEIAIAKSDVDGTSWLRVTPQKPLEPGEYGITYLPKDQMLFSDTVFDFTITAAK